MPPEDRGAGRGSRLDISSISARRGTAGSAGSTAVGATATLVLLLLGFANPAAAGTDGAEPPVTCRTDRGCSGYYRCLDGACAIPPAVLGRKGPSTLAVELVAEGASRGRFLVELARDGFAQGRGLSHRPSMAEGWGMLFVFPQTVRNPFTMELMRFPLDMVFVGDSGRVVDIIENAQPKQTGFVSSAGFTYVLELNAGAVSAHGIEVGDSLRVAGSALR